MPTFKELLKNRRSIRNFTKKDVSFDTIKQLIEESTLAPSAQNQQPWKFIVVTNQEMMKAISDESKKNILAQIESNPNDGRIKKGVAPQWLQPLIQQA